MTTPPTYHLRELGQEAQMMSRNCRNERMAMVTQYVALGCMIIMAGIAAGQVLKEAFGPSETKGRGRAR